MALRTRIPARYFGTGDNKHRYTAIAVATTKAAAEAAAKHHGKKNYPGRKIQVAPFPKGVDKVAYLLPEGDPKWVVYLQEWLVRRGTTGEPIPAWAYKRKKKGK